jgi:hypothetical protein
MTKLLSEIKLREIILPFIYQHQLIFVYNWYWSLPLPSKWRVELAGPTMADENNWGNNVSIRL